MTTETDPSADYTLALEAMKRQLQIRIPTTNKAPDKFDEKITACVSQNGVDAFLFRIGFQVWFAYLLAREGDRELISRIPKLSQCEQNNLAEQLKAVRADESYYVMADRLFNSSSRGGTRIRKLRQRFDFEIPESRGTSLEYSTTCPPPAEVPQPITRSEGKYEWPNANRLPRVFPTRLSRILKKVDGCAAVFASFSSDPTRCTLEFDVISRMVPFTAKELYNVHLSYDDERCLFILQDGVEIELLGSIVLRGASNVTSPGFIGPQLGMAYRNGHRYREEQFLGEELTQCLAMTVEADAASPGRLSLTMEAENLEDIVQNLWR